MPRIRVRLVVVVNNRFSIHDRCVWYLLSHLSPFSYRITDITHKTLVPVWQTSDSVRHDSLRTYKQPTICHPVLPLLALHIFDGVLRVAQLAFDGFRFDAQSGTTSGSIAVSMVDFRLEDTTVYGLSFVPAGAVHPHVALLTHARQSKFQKQTRVYELNMSTKVRVLLSCSSLTVRLQIAQELPKSSVDLADPYCSLITPVPDAHVGGVIVSSHRGHFYVRSKAKQRMAALPPPRTPPSSPCLTIYEL